MKVVFKYRKEFSRISKEIYRPIGEVSLRIDTNEIKIPMYNLELFLMNVKKK